MAAAMDDSIQRYPLLRLLIPYVIGVGLADAYHPYSCEWSTSPIWGTLLLLALLLVWILQRKVLYGVLASLLFFVLGWYGYLLARSDTFYEWPPDEVFYETRVVSEPQVRQRSILCEMEVMAMYDSAAWHRVDHKIFAYLEPCEEAKGLLPGDIICFKGRIRAPHNFSDSLTFDYARYITMQGAAGTAYLPLRRWHKVGTGTLSLRERMLRLRNHLSAKHMGSTFKGDALGVLSALTLGDKRALSQELRSNYSNAGAAHVLALSGMHVGIIYGMLALLLHNVFRRRKLRWLRELLTITVLWLFALLVSLQASVLRAVTMCTLYIIARWIADGSTSSLHILSLTALLMLLVHPLYLFDVSFQLSFMAMTAILWLEPYLERFFRRYNLHPILGYFVGLLCISLVAQLGTFPIVLHHFGSFPTYFLITNLIVVPCLSIVLLLTLVWWMLLLIGFPWTRLLAILLQNLVEWANSILVHIGQWPGAVLRAEEFSATSTFLTYLIILFSALFIVKKWKRGAVLALASLLALLFSLLLKMQTT